MPVPIDFYTWCKSADDPNAGIFRESCRLNGITVKIIACSSTCDKPDTLASALDCTPDDQLIVCTDSFDVICFGNLNSIAESFASFGSDLVFGAESLCFHHLPSSIRQFEEEADNGIYKYLNGGMFMGRAGAIREMLATLASWNAAELEEIFRESGAPGWFNDQTLFGHYASQHSDRVVLDRDARLFWNLVSDAERLDRAVDFDGRRILNRITKTMPSYVHVTQLRDYYYPLYLHLGRRAGVALHAGNCDFAHFDRFLTRTVPYISDYPCVIDPTLRSDLEATFAYRVLKIRQVFRNRWSRGRKWLGRKRRDLFAVISS
jgi:hypothetical protein